MLSPTLEQVKNLLTIYPTVPVFYEVLADHVTPIQVFMALRKAGTPSFMLESVENRDQWGRYSFIGVNPKKEVKINGTEIEIDGTKQTVENHIAYLIEMVNAYQSPVLVDKPKLTGGFIGYFGYDTIRFVEKKLVNVPEDDLNMPECHLCMYDEIVAFDHLTNRVIVIQNVHEEDDLETKYKSLEPRARKLIEQIDNFRMSRKERTDKKETKVISNITEEEYKSKVEKAKEYIRNGDIFQVVLSQRFEVESEADPFDVYRCLRTTNPSPYLYFFDFVDYQIAGASPEMLVSVTNGIVTTKPIAGTVPRGTTKKEDDILVRQLMHDPKEQAEHTMLVDLGRNDVGKVSRFGTVRVDNFMSVEKYSKVTHLVSDVQGDIFQVVLSQRFEVESEADPFDVYRCLRTTNPSPYLYFFDFVDYQIAGASPEMLVSVTNGIVTTKPIAGTVPRGTTKKEDDILVRQLMHDPKEQAEHTMLVDLGRNDVGKVSRFGTVRVDNFMSVEKYSKVTHLVSDVQGELREDKTALDALMSILPAGTLSGAPKVRAMEIIDELEDKKRGLYGGTVGYLAFDGNIDTCIAIRTVLFKDGKGYVQAGAGIVADSEPEKEYEETKNKALAVINAIKEAAEL